MSLMVPDQQQRSHHSVRFLTHNLSLFFFKPRHGYPSNQKEVNTVSRTLLVRPIALGEVPARSGCCELEQCAIVCGEFLRIETVDTQEIQGATFSSHSLASLGSGSTLITVFGQKRERSTGEAGPTAGCRNV